MTRRLLSATLGLVLLAGVTACADSAKPTTLPGNPGPIATVTATATPDPTPGATATVSDAGTTTQTAAPVANQPSPTTSTAPSASSTPDVWAWSFCDPIVSDEFRLDVRSILRVHRAGGLTATMAIQAIRLKLDTYRELLQRAMDYYADPQLDAALSALRSATDEWVPILQSTGSLALVEGLIDDPAYVAVWQAAREICS